MGKTALAESYLVTFISGAGCNFWSLNPYELCDFRCTYCIAGVQGASSAGRNRSDILKTIERKLQDIPHDPPVLLGGISDAYPYAEAQEGISREILQLLNEQQRPYGIVTKATLMERDTDLLLANPGARVVVSFCTLDDELAKRYEPGAPVPSERIAMLTRLHDLGIDVRVGLRPWMPVVSDIEGFLAAIPEGIPIGLERLKITRASGLFSIEGKTYTQREIDGLYQAERKKYKGNSRLKWTMDPRFSVEDDAQEHPLIVIARDAPGFDQWLSEKVSS